MNFNDYILEAAGVSDVDVLDIELTQAFAEMAVLEAMIACYEKQEVLLEYNEESAEEIFIENDFNLPFMEDWVVEASKNKKSEPKNAVDEKVSELKGQIEEKIKDAKIGAQIKSELHQKDAKVKAVGTNLVIAVSKPKSMSNMVWAGAIDSPAAQFESESEAKKYATELNNAMKAHKPNPIKADELVEAINNNTFKDFIEKTCHVPVWRSKGFSFYHGAATSNMGNSRYEMDENDRSYIDRKVKEAEDNYKGNKKAAAADLLGNGKGAAVKRFFAKLWETLLNVVNAIINLFKNRRLDHMANAIRNSKKEQMKSFELTIEEMNALEFLKSVKDFSATLVRIIVQEETMNRQGKKIKTDFEAEKKLAQLKAQLDRYRLKTFVGDQLEGSGKDSKEWSFTPEELANTLDTLHKQNIYKEMEFIRNLFNKSKTTYDPSTTLPDRIYKMLRQTTDEYCATFTKSIKVLNKLVKAITSKDAMNVGSRGKQINPYTYSQELEIEKNASGGSRRSENSGNSSNITKTENDAAEAASWAEEGWSMNLEEDESFF